MVASDLKILHWSQGKNGSQRKIFARNFFTSCASKFFNRVLEGFKIGLVGYTGER